LNFIAEADALLLVSIAGGLALVLLLLLAWRWLRRRRRAVELLAAVTGGAFDWRRDVLVPDGQGGWVHMDFLLLTSRGCVILDLRDVSGNIFGGDQMTDWTVMQRTRRFTFVNPQTGLYDRIAVVRAQVTELPIDGRVLFSERGKFPKGLPRFTMMLDSIRAEYPVADRHGAAALPDAWHQDWLRLAAACRSSHLVDPHREF
jgi:hypothetical protein